MGTLLDNDWAAGEHLLGGAGSAEDVGELELADTDEGDFRTTGLAIDASGAFYLARTLWRNGADDVGFLSKYSAARELIWEHRIEGAPGLVEVEQVAIGADGSVCVVGRTTGSLGRANPNVDGSDGFARAYSPDGAVLWTWQDGSGTTKLIGVAADPGGGFIVGGSTGGTFQGQVASFDKGIVLRLDADGQQTGIAFFDTDDVQNVSWTTDLALSPSGAVFATGHRVGHIDSEYLDFRHGYLGVLASGLAITHHVRLGAERAATDVDSVASDPAGNAVIVATTSASWFAEVDDTSAVVAKYDAEGQLLWGRQFRAPPAMYSDPDTTGRAVTVLADGTIVVVGAVGNEQLYLRAYSEAGTPLWTKVFPAAYGSYYNVLTASPDGTLYIATGDQTEGYVYYFPLPG